LYFIEYYSIQKQNIEALLLFLVFFFVPVSIQQVPGKGIVKRVESNQLEKKLMSIHPCRL
jgi:hypothetical protein